MTDYYTQFSAKISSITEEERSWIQALEGDEPDFSEIVSLVGERNTADLTDYGCLGFVSDSRGPDWRFYADESGDIENVAVVVQAFFKKFRPRDSLLLEWANICSKMEPGAFNGGVVLVTAHFSYFEPSLAARMQVIYDASPDENVDAVLVEAAQQLINETSDNSEVCDG